MNYNDKSFCPGNPIWCHSFYNIGSHASLLPEGAKHRYELMSTDVWLEHLKTHLVKCE